MATQPLCLVDMGVCLVGSVGNGQSYLGINGYIRLLQFREACEATHQVLISNVVTKCVCFSFLLNDVCLVVTQVSSPLAALLLERNSNKMPLAVQ